MSTQILPDVGPYAFVSLPSALSYVQRDSDQESNAEEWIRRFLNTTTDLLEAETRRPLAARVYRTAITRSFTLTEGETTATGDTTDLRARDEVTAASGVPIGTLVESITSAGELELTKEATASGAVDLTFGFGPLICSGRCPYVWSSTDGYNSLAIGVSPLVEVISIRERLTDDTLGDALDLTGARIVAETLPGHSKVILPNDSIPYGEQNLEVECVAGYLPPAAGRSRTFSEGWHSLEQAQWRCLIIAWSDWMNQRGRTGRFQLFQASEFVDDFRLPDDVRSTLRKFQRFA